MYLWVCMKDGFRLRVLPFTPLASGLSCTLLILYFASHILALPVCAQVAPGPIYVWLERRNLDLCSTLRGCSRRADCEETTFRYIMKIGPAQMRGGL